MKKRKLRKYRRSPFEVYPAEEIFRNWLEENRHRFNHKLVLKEKRNGHVVYGFEGIIDNITLHISFDSPEASLGFDNSLEFHDNIEDTYFDMMYIAYIGYEKYHPIKGYYDDDRTDEIYDYFPTQKELYVTDVFEHIIETTNELFVAKNSLYLLHGSYFTAGYIKSTDDVESNIGKAYSLYKYDLFGNEVEGSACEIIFG